MCNTNDRSHIWAHAKMPCCVHNSRDPQVNLFSTWKHTMWYSTNTIVIVVFYMVALIWAAFTTVKVSCFTRFFLHFSTETTLPFAIIAVFATDCSSSSTYVVAGTSIQFNYRHTDNTSNWHWIDELERNVQNERDKWPRTEGIQKKMRQPLQQYTRSRGSVWLYMDAVLDPQSGSKEMQKQEKETESNR